MNSNVKQVNSNKSVSAHRNVCLRALKKLSAANST